MNLNDDNQFFALFKRMMEKLYKDPSGTSGLQAKNLIRPQKQKIVTSNGANWTRIYINRAVYIWTPDRRQIDYVSGHNPGDLSADTSKPWNSSVSGVAKLYAPGEWHVKTPLLSGDTEGATIVLIESDAALGIEGVNLTGADVAAAPPPIAFNANRSAFGTGQQTVTTADGAHAVQLGALVVPNGFFLTIKALSSNTKNIYLGNSQANAQAHTTAYILAPGESVRLQITNANLCWIDAQVATEGVCFGAEA
jgi:hypothetical protein